MLKKELRSHYKQLRDSLSAQEIELMSQQIAEQSLQLPIWGLHYYHLFLSMESQKEVNTEYLFSKLCQQNKKLVVSKSDFDTYSLQHFLWSETTQIKINAYGIPEPMEGVSINEHEIDVVFIPLLAFDKNGNRLGYGKGFYDRFLSKCLPQTVKIGLSFFPPTNTLIKTHPKDIPLDYVISPKRVYRF